MSHEPKLAKNNKKILPGELFWVLRGLSQGGCHRRTQQTGMADQKRNDQTVLTKTLRPGMAKYERGNCFCSNSLGVRYKDNFFSSKTNFIAIMKTAIDLPGSGNVSTQMKEHKETRTNRLSSYPCPPLSFMNVGLEENTMFR